MWGRRGGCPANEAAIDSEPVARKLPSLAQNSKRLEASDAHTGHGSDPIALTAAGAGTGGGAAEPAPAGARGRIMTK